MLIAVFASNHSTELRYIYRNSYVLSSLLRLGKIANAVQRKLCRCTSLVWCIKGFWREVHSMNLVMAGMLNQELESKLFREHPCQDSRRSQEFASRKFSLFFTIVSKLQSITQRNQLPKWIDSWHRGHPRDREPFVFFANYAARYLVRESLTALDK